MREGFANEFETIFSCKESRGGEYLNSIIHQAAAHVLHATLFDLEVIAQFYVVNI